MINNDQLAEAKEEIHKLRSLLFDRDREIVYLQSILATFEFEEEIDHD